MSEKILVTGGAGFIGCHCVRHFASMGYQVVVIDNLSRKGTHRNLTWLQEHFPIIHHQVDIRDRKALEGIFESEGPFSAIIHLAGQVGVTTSVVCPLEDFEINAKGTIFLLECLRTYSPDSLFIYSSTNKVYGELVDVPLVEDAKRYRLSDIKGISETRSLDFHSPYGCSKGCADQYVIDYARIYGLHTVVFRQSCIYGERQFGVEDQGWVAWFIIAGVLGLPLTLYGNGKQVRDLLYVQDLIDLYALAVERRKTLNGIAYNIGGGIDNSLSLLDLIEMLRLEGLLIECRYDQPRPGDQKIFISDNGKVCRELAWQPKVSCQEGIRRLTTWIRQNRDMLKEELMVY